MTTDSVRVRFAPSPTGYLHVGGLRTALYNYLFAKSMNGKFILRIEDTDRKRFVEGAVENLLETLKWVGLNYDEGPDKQGDFGPYSQSERLDIYKEHIQKLIDDGKAYYCFCTPERLQNLREEQQKQKLPQAMYDKHCLNLSKEEIDKKLANGDPYVIRLNVTHGEKIKFVDVIRDVVEFSSDTVDDQVLIKSDGFPTYHFANVVDDHLMKITHVIRGEEWLSSTPKHVLLYNAMGWELPTFAHLPLLLNADKSKLSKRQGDVAVEDYKAKGYLKDALVNFVALLGWHGSDDKEFYNMSELIESFSLERVQKAGAVFNVEKLDWLNAEHLRHLSNEEILPMFKIELAQSEYSNLELSDDYLLSIINAMKERVSFVKELVTNSPYFYKAPSEYDEKVLAKRWKPESPALLKKLTYEFTKLENPVKEDFENTLHKIAEESEVGMGKLIHPIRLAVSGVGIGPGVYDLLIIVGKDEVIKRINTALEKIKLPE